jgi:two-component system phosphate regulon sensor histidine kinase PhoR
MYILSRNKGSETLLLLTLCLSNSFLVAVLVSLVVYKTTQRIKNINTILRSYAMGNLAPKARWVGSTGDDDIDELAELLNHTAEVIRQIMDELSREKSKLQTIFDKADDGFIVVDKESQINLINPAALHLIKAEASQIIGKTIIEATLNHDLSKLVERVIKTNTAGSLQIELPKGEPTFLNVYAAPIEPTGALVVMHDITEAKRIDAIRRDFVSNVSHELRTPLASIRVMAETIALRGKTHPHVSEEFAQKIISEVDRLTAISNDLLDLAQIEAGRRNIRSEEFVLKETVETAIAGLVPKAEQKAIELSIRIPDHIVVNADKGAVHQIITNLVDNAVKYTRPSGSITITATESNGWVSISVADTGIGIPQEDIPRIFERFYRVDKARSRESGGTGLGLSIVKHLVEMQGGKVNVESQLGKGSVFTFTIPAKSS